MFESLFNATLNTDIYIWLIAIYACLLMSGAGLPMPEEIPLLFLSILYFQERLSSPIWILLAIFFVSLADFCLYNIGKYLGLRIFKHPFLKRNFNEHSIQKVNNYIHRFGYKVIILGRLLLGVRTAIFLSAGILRMPQNKFIFYDFIASCISVSLFMFISTQMLKKFDGEFQEVQAMLKRYQMDFTLIALSLIACVILFLVIRNFRTPRKKKSRP